jgi:CHAD domain-containing protein
VRRHLDAACAASGRLADAGDVEALHDCRVAIRRLRVALGAYDPLLRPGVPKELRRALKVLAGHTGPARDAEVFVAWLEGRASRLRGPARDDAAWLLGEISRRRDAEYRRLRKLIPKALALIAPLLRAGLSARGGRRGTAPVPGFRPATARFVAAEADEFARALARVRGPTDHDRIHRARIAAKKVRYLIEPALSRRGAGVLKPLRRVQDLLGAFHDAGQVRLQVARARRFGSVRHGVRLPPRPGLAAIVAMAERDEGALYRRIAAQLLRGAPACLVPLRRWIRRHQAP